MDFVFFESIFCLISCFWSKNKNPFHHDQKRVLEKKKEKKKNSLLQLMGESKRIVCRKGDTLFEKKNA